MRRTERSIFKFLGFIVALFGGYYLYMILSGRDEVGSSTEKKDKKSKSNVKKAVKANKSFKDPKLSQKPNKVSSQTLREQRIMSLLQRKDSAGMADIRKLFPGLNVRTIRRDMDRMVNKGYVKQTGATRSTVYVKK
ncbi:MAG: hypothetical protein U9Q67_04550 [Patescibacteria group bacterium]|nr:hypothetical protein [Patescibacteria group bacterium]